VPVDLKQCKVQCMCAESDAEEIDNSIKYKNKTPSLSIFKCATRLITTDFITDRLLSAMPSIFNYVFGTATGTLCNIDISQAYFISAGVLSGKTKTKLLTVSFVSKHVG